MGLEFTTPGSGWLPAGSSADIGSPIDSMVQGIKQLEDWLQTTITWNGKEYPCAGGPKFGGKRLEFGGFRPMADVRIKVRAELFEGGNLPQEKQTLLYKGGPNVAPKRLKIDSITDFWGAVLQLDCNDPSQGG